MNRFWNKVEKSDSGSCWEWKAAVLAGGYGQFFYEGKQQKAHRVSWIIANGEIPKGMVICHKCDNRRCVNPAHLFLGTQRDNVRDMMGKGRNNFISGWKPLLGSRNPMAKIAEHQVHEIRELAGKIPYTKIAERYGISAASVCLIIKKINWSHV